MKIECKAKKKEGKKLEKRKNHRRDGLPAEGYEGAANVTFSLDTVVAHPGSLLGVSLREKEKFVKFNKTTEEVTKHKNKTHMQ